MSFKSGFAVAVFMLVTAGAAQSNCSTANLAGNWLAYDGTKTCSVTVSSVGAATGTCGTGTLSMTSACKLSGTFNGKSVAGRSEALGTASTLKPNLLMVSSGTTTFNVLYRK